MKKYTEDISMLPNCTLTYYETHAEEYIQSTYPIDMSPACDRFLKYIPQGGRIIDIGCGSGRDMKYFRSKGYVVEGLDASASMCKKAAQYTGLPVTCIKMQSWRPHHAYDGIWSCASLLHLTEESILQFMQTARQALKTSGVIRDPLILDQIHGV